MANYIVTTIADEDDAGATVDTPLGFGLSLREAIILANANPGMDTITFASGVGEAFENGGTIVLALGTHLEITVDVLIDGDLDDDGKPDVTVDADGNSRVILVSSGTADFEGLIITGGDAGGTENGGGILVESGATANLIGSSVTGNQANFRGGGGIANNGTTTLNNTTVRDNSASEGGGIYSTGSLMLTNSTVSGNDGKYGGGIYNLGTAAISTSTFSGNTANYFGGGIYHTGAGTLMLTNGTVSGNSAASEGGGIYTTGGSGEFTARNSIVLGNSAGTNAELSLNSTATLIRTITIGDKTLVFAAIDGVTGGGLLADNGGPVQTIALKADTMNPALDFGEDGDGPGSDARGLAYHDAAGVMNNGANISDVGAYELQIAESLVVTTIDDVVDLFDGETSLREAIMLANSTDGPDTITFASGMGEAFENGGTIYLSMLTQLEITSDVTIDGDLDDDGTPDVTVDANSAMGMDDAESRVFLVSSGTTRIDGLTITGGDDDIGGGLRADGTADVMLTNSIVSGNHATFRGGGLYTDGGTLTLIGSTVSGNVTDILGGGIYNYEGTLTITGSTISGNEAGVGAGIFSSGILTLTDSTVSSNEAGSVGGGISSFSMTTTLINSTVSGNNAGLRGGGLYGINSTISLTNATISGNSSYRGGGLYTYSGSATLTNSTVSGNYATESGGGLFNYISSTVTLTNSIVLGNSAALGGEVSGAFTNTGALSLVGGTPADVFAAIDPSTPSMTGGLLADNGGPVWTIALKSDPSNPALDAGDDTLDPDTDARGISRYDFPGVANNDANISDLGAYELLKINDPPVVTVAASGLIPDGGEFLVNTTTDSNQQLPAIATLTGGRFVIAWQDQSGTAPDTSSQAVRAQIYEADGTPVGGEFLVNTITTGAQRNPEITALTNGGFVVTWESITSDGASGDTDGVSVRAQVFDADGGMVGGEIAVNTATADDQDEMQITALAGGGFVITWEDDSGTAPDGNQAVRAQVFAADGTPVGTEILVNTSTASFQATPFIAALTGGGFVITFADASNGGPAQYDVRAQVFAADGTPVGTEILVDGSVGRQLPDAIAPLSNGGFVISYANEGPNTPLFRIYDAAGNPVTGSIDPSVTADNAFEVIVTGLPGGGCVVAWVFDNDPDFGEIYARIYANDGTPVSGEFHVNTSTAGLQSGPDAVAVPGGGFVISWYEQDAVAGDTSGSAIRAQAFDRLGNKLGGEVLVNSTTEGDQLDTVLAVLPNFGVAVAWTDRGSTGPGDMSGRAVRAQLFDSFPETYVAIEQLQLDLKGVITISDPDAGSGDLTVTLEVDFGILTVEPGTSGADVTGSGTGAVTITATLAELEALLDTDATSVVAYTPNSDAPPASAVLTVSANDNGNSGDGGAMEDSQVIAIDIIGLNDAPVNAAPVLQTMAEDGILVFNAANGNAISVADADAGSGDLTVTLSIADGALTLSQTTGLAVIGNAGNNVVLTGTLANINAALDGMSYAPPADTHGPRTLNILTSDNGNTGEGGTMTDSDDIAITVLSVNDPPVAIDDNVVTPEDTAAVIAVLANDSDVDGPSLNLVSATAPVHGAVVVNPDGTITYTPDPDYFGPDGFDYEISDGAGGTDTGHVAITVTPVNDPPTAPATNLIVTDEDTPSAPVPIGAMDVESTSFSYSIPLSAQPGRGSVSFVGDAIVYTPDPDENGIDHFDVIISDGGFAFVRQEVWVTINPVNDDPVANDDAAATDEDVPLDIAAAALLDNDSDVDGDMLTVTGVSGAVNGTVVLMGSTVTFTPDPGFFGTAGFDYEVSDGNGGTDSAHVTVTVGEFVGNHPPVVTPDAQDLATIEDTPLAFSVTASDADDDPLSITPGTPVNGMVTDNGDGTFTYTPDPGFSGIDMFTMLVSDGNGGTDEQLITVAVKDIPEGLDWRLFAGDGWAGTVGGTGQVIGTGGFQSVKVLDLPGTVSFDPSFNGGEDFICVSGNAADWSVVRSGSSAILFDGDTCVVIPVGSEGLAIGFDDGNRTLFYDTEAQSLWLGAQEVTGSLAPVAVAPDGAAIPPGEDGDALARLFLAEGGSVAAGGTLEVIGTNGAEELTLLFGSAGLDASFNIGNDMLVLSQPTGDFTAARSGSLALFDSAATDVSVPVGSAGMAIAFADTTAILVYDAMADAVFVGSQMIDATPMPLTFA